MIYESKAFDAPGVAHHDVFDFGQSLSLETSKLADVAAEVLGGTTKTDLAIQEVMDIMRTSPYFVEPTQCNKDGVPQGGHMKMAEFIEDQ